MPDKTVTIQINTSAELKGLNDLIEKITASQKMLEGFGKGTKQFGEFTRHINTLVGSMEKLQTLGRGNPLGRLNTSLTNMNRTIQGMGRGQRQFEGMVRSINSLSG